MTDGSADGVAAVSDVAKKHRAKNRLIVDEADTDDNSMICMSLQKVRSCNPLNACAWLENPSLPAAASTCSALHQGMPAPLTHCLRCIRCILHS